MAGGNWKEMFNAAVAEDMELLNFHIKMGIDIDYQHPEYLTSVFIETIRLNKLKAARFLLEKGADMYVQESFGKDTATSIAIAAKNYEALTLMNEFKKTDEQVDIAALKATHAQAQKAAKSPISMILVGFVILILAAIVYYYWI